MSGDVEHQPVDGVKMLAHFLNHDDVPRQSRHQRRAAEHGQGHEIEGDSGMVVKRGFEARTVASEIAQRPADGPLAALAADVGGHWAVDWLADLRPIERGEQIAAVGIAHEQLVLRGAAHLVDSLLGNPVRAIATAGEPDAVDPGIVCAFEQRGEAQLVRPGEMAVALEALRMDVERNIGKFRLSQGHDARGVFVGEGCGGGANGDTGHGCCVTAICASG